MKNKKIEIYLLALWFAVILSAFSGLWWYKTRPGINGPAPQMFPASADFSLASAPQYTLVMFLHPKCECSDASLYELVDLLKESKSHIVTYLVFYYPKKASENWAHTSLWAKAKEQPDIHILFDKGGRRSFQFGALTSGQTLVYDPSGKLLYSGGITESRGHIGESPGKRSIASIAKGETNEQVHHDDFGCSILSAQELDELTKEAKNDERIF